MMLQSKATARVWTLLCELIESHFGEYNVVKTSIRKKTQINVFYDTSSDEHIDHI